MKRGILAAGALFLVVSCAQGATSSGISAGSAAMKSAQPAGGPTGASQAETQAAPAPLTGQGPKVIRTGRITVEIPDGRFASKLGELEDLMAGLAGFVSGSEAAAQSGSLREGSVTFEVPSEHFQAALDGTRRLGKVQAYVVTGQDVSNQYVDLQARLANEEAVREAMLQFFKDAHSVQDDVTIENQLGQVTAQIEQLQGQIHYLEQATAYSTVTVTLREAAAATAASGEDRWGFRTALDRAAHNFVYVIDGILETAGSALPFLLLLIPLYFALRHRRSLARILAL